MKFKLDENLSPTLAAGFLAAGHEAHSVLELALGGASDPRVIEVCRLENRALVTIDLDFANIQRNPPANYARHHSAAVWYSGQRRGRCRGGQCHPST